MHEPCTTPSAIPRRLDVEGWRGFPIPHLWDPFHPQLVLGFDLSRGDRVTPQLFESYATPSLDEAVANLANGDRPRVVYNVLPAQRIAEVKRRVETQPPGAPRRPAPARHLFAYELCWPLRRRGTNAPRRVERPDEGRLWVEPLTCHAFCVIDRDFGGSPLRLTVGGANSEDCVRSWRLVAGWMRERLAGGRR